MVPAANHDFCELADSNALIGKERFVTSAQLSVLCAAFFHNYSRSIIRMVDAAHGRAYLAPKKTDGATNSIRSNTLLDLKTRSQYLKDETNDKLYRTWIASEVLGEFVELVRTWNQERSSIGILCQPHSADIAGGKLRVVNGVEELSAQFKSFALRNRKLLDNRHVKIVDADQT
jgi:hypothetical protein